MNSQEEIQIRLLIQRARECWQDDLEFFQNDPYANPIDEPIYEDYLTEEIHNYAKQYTRRNQQTGN